MSSFCGRCGSTVPAGNRYCERCGREASYSDAGSVAIAAAEEKPWYFSPIVLILTFLFLTPLGAVLIFRDRSQRTGVKWAAAIIGAIYLVLIGSSVLGASPLSAVTGPGVIEFGTEYRAAGDGFAIVGAKGAFGVSEQVAWVARLKGPANTRTLDIGISKVTGKGESVVSTEPMSIADPGYTVLAGQFPAVLLVTVEPATYRVRVYSGNTVLALGEFQVRGLRSQGAPSSPSAVPSAASSPQAATRLALQALLVDPLDVPARGYRVHSDLGDERFWDRELVTDSGEISKIWIHLTREFVSDGRTAHRVARDTSECRYPPGKPIPGVRVPSDAVMCTTTMPSTINTSNAYAIVVDGGTRDVIVHVRVNSRSAGPFSDLQAAATLAATLFEKQIQKLPK